MHKIEAIIFGRGSLDDGAHLYEDVVPALTELKAMGVRLLSASPIPQSLAGFLHPMDVASLDPECTIFLTDNEAGLKQAKSMGVHAVLMMNDPDEARRLAMHDPAGGIVSLHELPDFIRLVAAENARQTPS